MNGEDAATYARESMLSDARFEIDYAMERERYAASKGYNLSNNSNYINDMLNIMRNIVDYASSLEERIKELEEIIYDNEKEEETYKSPFILIDKSQTPIINAQTVNQIQLTDKQLERLINEIV